MSQLEMEEPWAIIESYFKNHHLQRLVRHHLESYNALIHSNIEKTIDMFNPVNIRSPQDYDEESNSYISNSGQRYPIFSNGAVCLLPAIKITNEILLKRERAFSRKGSGHSWAFNHWHDLRLGQLIPAGTGGKLLNFGSGHAREKDLLRAKGHRVIALDVDPMDGVDVVADGHALPFRDRAFETVVSFEVLEHVKRPWQVVGELARVLKPHGSFVGSVAFLKPFHQSYFHMTHKGITSLLEDSGFKVEVIYGGQNFLSTLFRLTYPLGPAQLSMCLYDKMFSMTSQLYGLAWSFKHRLSAKKALPRFEAQFEFNYLEWRQIINAGCIVFRGTRLSH